MNSTNDGDFGDSKRYPITAEILPASTTSRALAPHVARETSGSATSDAAEVDFSRYLHAVRRTWILGLVLGIIAAGPLVVLAWWLMPMEYMAAEFVRISLSQTSPVLESSDAIRPAEFKSFKNTQRQLVVQPYALNKALKQLVENMEKEKLPSLRTIVDHPDPIGWLTKELKVTFPDDSEILRVELTDTDPVLAHRVVNAVIDTYWHDNVEKEKAERLARLETLEKILRETEDKVRKKRSDFSNLVQSLGMSDKATVDLQQQLTLQQSGQVRSQLAKVKFDIMTLANRRALLASANPGPQDPAAPKNPSNGSGGGQAPDSKSPPVSTAGQAAGSETAEGTIQPTAALVEEKDPLLEDLLETDKTAVQLTKEVERYQKLIEQTKQRYDEKTAAEFLVKYQAKLDETQKKLAERTKRLQRRIPEKITPTNELENLNVEIGIFRQQEELLSKEMAQLLDESKRFGKSSIDVEMLRKEIDALEPMVAKLNQNVERTKIERESASRITRYTSTGVPNIGENKKRIPVMVLAGLVGLFGPMALLALRDFLRNHVNDAATFGEGVKISVLGSIPRVPKNVMRRLNDPNHKTAKQWRERIGESITGVSSMLLRKLAAEGHRVVMVSSAVTGEGKSTLAELLARNLAETGHRTLLIDFDLRRPQLHRRFNVPLGPGVSEVLRGGADLKQSTRKTNCHNLELLTAGSCPGNLLLEAANGTCAALFKECRDEYELVIVDTSPLLPVVDARLIGQFTDGAIVSVIKDSSQIPRVLAGRNIMRSYGMTVLGCVVMGDSREDYYNAYGPSGDTMGTVAIGVSSSRSMSAM